MDGRSPHKNTTRKRAAKLHVQENIKSEKTGYNWSHIEFELSSSKINNLLNLFCCGSAPKKSNNDS